MGLSFPFLRHSPGRTPEPPASTADFASLRNTDADWTIIGAEDPYFGVLTDPRFHRDRITEDDKAAFFASGKSEIEALAARMQALVGRFEPKSALDFGCGVGRLTRPLAELTGDAVGFDVSPGMLAEARRQPVSGARFVDVFPERRFDWVVSYIVLQHITPEQGYREIRRLLKAVAPGGGISLQITFARTAESGGVGGRLVIADDDVRPAGDGQGTLQVPEGIMIMHDYDLGRVAALFYIEGFRSLHLDFTNHGGPIGAMICARRD